MSEIAVKYLAANQAIMKACENGDLYIIENLIASKCVNINGDIGRDALYTATRRSYNEIVRCLIENGVVANYNALEIACSVGNFALVRYFFEEADIDVNGGGGSLIRVACERRNLDIIKYLIGRGATLNDYYFSGNALASAIEAGGQMEIFHYLLEQAGANVNGRKGDEPLNSAIDAGELAIVKRLMERGANFRSVSMKKEKIDEATSNGFIELADYLRRCKVAPKEDLDVSTLSDFSESCCSIC